MIKVLVIAPYQGLAEVVKNLRHEDEDLQIEVKVGNLEEGIQIAKAAEAEGYDLIISRGGTASQVEAEINIPVVDIHITGYDMLRVFALLKGLNGQAALVGFPNISRGAATICSILDMNVRSVTISSREEVTKLLPDLKKEGFSVVIGDVVTVRQAEQMGLQGILITSGKEAVLQSFEEAKRLYHSNQKMQAQTAVYADMIERFPQAVVTVNEAGEVIQKNQLFRDQFTSSIVEAPDLQALLKQILTQRQGIWRSVTLQKRSYHAYGYPTSEDKSFVTVLLQPQSLGAAQGVKVRNHVSHIPISGRSRIAEDMRKQLKQYANLEEAIWIEGEVGTGRMMFACNLHFETFGQQAPLISFDCSVVSMKDVSGYISSKNQLLPEKATIVFQHVHLIKDDEQSALKSLVEELTAKYTVILLSDGSVRTRMKEGRFDQALFYSLPAVTIQIPPLRERIEDIQDLAQAFIARNHMNYGYEAIGLRPEALEPLLDYDWPGNISQLKQAIDKLMIANNQSYIEKSDVETMMSDVTKETTMTMHNALPLEGTLKDMERAIIEKVMEQENHNQSKAAKRLGMNRTTLWRKLNS
ncbi:sigma-54-dependent Fis family transcriptional regulator [Bacillaceae bacterium SIJ1]|uniref:sigma-54-dependent transcriptional regulator n=1 Tax=Litoribacterium kuwaitense TaxID=1398745 RepID=UPI0013EABD89|nr:sigma-54-dependent transcriptional regulator [Litoribacterium kuwaitense]NGP45156.1 sigma-54-dependent Fis family transcriptional regulator [Litoribacterium kuwaitense]